MARTAEHSAKELGSRTARQRLPIRPRPYFAHVSDALSIGYRSGQRGGTWIARSFDAEHSYRFKPLGKANDLTEDVGMSFQAAQDAARLWFAGQAKEDRGDFGQGPYRVEQAMADYLADRERAKRRKLPHTYAAIHAHILPKLGQIEVDRLTQSKIKGWRDALADAAPRARTRPGKPQAYREYDPSDSSALRARQATVNRILTTLKAALNLAVDNGKVQSREAWERVKPFLNVDLAKVRFLTMDEVRSLLSVCEGDFRLLVQGALLTGCRYGELAAMKSEAFDEQNQTVFIPESKNGKARHVHLSNDGISFFRAMAKGKFAKDHMFIKANGKTWQKSEQKRPIDMASEAAKLEQVTFHILRHTYASHLAMAGTPMTVIASQLGHTSTRITEKHYAHLSQSFVRQTIQANLPSFEFAA